MKHNYPILTAIAFVLSFAFAGCKKDTPKNVTPKITDDNVEVTATTATFTWTVEWPGKLISVVEVSEHEDMSNSKCYGDEVETGEKSFSVSVNNLKADTKYYYRFLVWNRYYVDRKFVMEQKSFYIGNVPIVTTKEVTDITGSSAKVIGEVVDDNGFEVTERGVCWSNSPSPTVANSHQNSGAGTGSFTVSIYGLNYMTTYYVRTYATNDMGTMYGEEISFVAREISLPIIGGYVEMKTITHNSGAIYYSIYDNGGATITAHGLCWSTDHNPTINSNCVDYGLMEGNFSFTGVMEDLPSNTTYYVRAYATNNKGTEYGKEISFTTHNSSHTIPIGAVNGHFSINSEGSKVWFSQGNLQYQASNHRWRFAEHQYDYVGGSHWDTDYGNVYENGLKCSNNEVSSTYSGWIDLYGWGTSGWNCGNTYYHPWDTQSSVNQDYDSKYGPQNGSNLTGWCVNSDWGIYNAIDNGGNQLGLWRTLTHDEWDYVFNTRNTSSGIRYAKVQIDNVNGVILLPDDWTISYYSISEPNNSSSNFNSNIITIDQWNIIEQYGAVFLPAAGWRRSYDYENGAGNYWSASNVFSGENATVSGRAFYMWFSNYGLYANDESFHRSYGYSVRLVCDVE